MRVELIEFFGAFDTSKECVKSKGFSLKLKNDKQIYKITVKGSKSQNFGRNYEVDWPITVNKDKEIKCVIIVAEFIILKFSQSF